MAPYQPDPAPKKGPTAEQREDAPTAPGVGDKTSRRGVLRSLVRHGLLAACVTAGMRAVQELLEDEVTGIAGVKGKHNPERKAFRHGYENGEVTLGGRRLAIRRPRVRSADRTEEVPLPTYEHIASRDLLNKMALVRMTAGLSTRRYEIGLEPVGGRAAHRGTSKSCISRRFVALTRTAFEELMSADLRGLKPVVLMVDGANFAKHQCVVALVVDVDGQKHPVGVVAGATENARVVTDLLADLVDRGLDTSHGILVVIDGAKALAAAVRRVFGDRAVIQRCIEHKTRNVEDYLHADEKTWVRRTMRKAWRRTSAEAARKDLLALAHRLDDVNPDAARSLREGLEDTLAFLRLGVGNDLARTLRSTNAIEPMWEIVRATHRNVKHWKDGDMRLRWAAAGMVMAHQQFRRVQGWRDLPALARTLYLTVTPTEPQAEKAA